MTAENLEKIKKLKAFQLIPKLTSTDIEWINWMKLLDKDFDRTTSVAIFLNLWKKRGTTNARTLTLRNFMKDKYNVDLSEGVIDAAVDLGGGFVDTIGGVFKVGKVVFLVTTGIIVVAVGAAIYSVIKNPSNLAYATPQGRALKMLKVK
jgi:hypothetical protein